MLKVVHNHVDFVEDAPRAIQFLIERRHVILHGYVVCQALVLQLGQLFLDILSVSADIKFALIRDYFRQKLIAIAG